jgi:hypothetical protein
VQRQWLSLHAPEWLGHDDINQLDGGLLAAGLSRLHAILLAFSLPGRSKAMATAPFVLTGLDRSARFTSWRLSNAELLWIVFVLVQALDGAMSYVGVWLHGPEIEGNPLVAWYLSVFGPALGFTVAKLFAVGCGAVLYLTGRHRWMALVTIVYLLFAVGPWIHLLSTGI